MIDIQHSNERNFCGAITPKEKDKIMKAIGSADFPGW